MFQDKKLFTPGPLSTSKTVKSAMLRDLGSRDEKFISIVKDIRKKLLTIAGAEENYEAVIMQGSGTFGIEAVISSVIPGDGKLLVVVNGAYGERLVKMAKAHRIPVTALSVSENQLPSIDEIDNALYDDKAITHVAVVHCETTTGIINPIEQIGQAVKRYGKIYIVDAMSSFGAVPVDFEKCGIDFLISSSNKCLEGVPGFSFIIAKKEKLNASKDNARTLSLDLYAQWKGLEDNGQFRFTPPTHALLAFHQALAEFEQEGGVSGRMKRYMDNHRLLTEGMEKLGFEPYLPSELQGYIITSFHYPKHLEFDFKKFYDSLNQKGFVIYPGKLTHADCFRIGNIGRIFPGDINALLDAIRMTMEEL